MKKSFVLFIVILCGCVPPPNTQSYLDTMSRIGTTEQRQVSKNEMLSCVSSALNTPDTQLGQSDQVETFVQLGGFMPTNINASEDGEHILFQSGTDLKLLDRQDFRELRSYPVKFNAMLANVSFVDNGSRILVSGKLTQSDAKPSVTVLETKTGKQLADCELEKSLGIIGVFSTDGSLYVDSDYRNLKIWDTASGRVLHSINKGEGFLAPERMISQDNKSLLEIDTVNNKYRLWNLETGQIQSTFAGTKGFILAKALSPDGRRALTAKQGNRITLWDTINGRIIKEFTVPETSGIFSLAFMPGSDQAMVGAIPGLLLQLDLNSGELTNKYIQAVLPAISSNNSSNLVLAAGGGVMSWDLEHWNPTKKWQRLDENEMMMLPSPNQRYISSWQSDGSGNYNGIKVFDAETGNLLFERAFEGVISYQHFTSNSRYLRVTALHQNHEDIAQSVSKSHFLELPSGREVRSIEKKSFWSVPLGSDGNSYLIANESGVALFDIAHGKKLKSWRYPSGILSSSFEYAKDSPVHNLSQSADGKRLVISGIGIEGVQLWHLESGRTQLLQNDGVYIHSYFTSDDKHLLLAESGGKMEMHDAKTGAPLQTFQGHSGFVASVAEVPNKKNFVTAGMDGTVRIWEIDSGRELAQLAVFDGGEWVMVTPEGFFNASENGAKYLNVRIGEGLNVYSMDQFYDRLYRPDLVTALLSGDQPEELTLPTVNLAQMVGQGGPPKVTILSPKEQVTNQRDIKIIASLADQGGGIGKLEWRINGIVLGVDEPGRGIAVKEKQAAGDIKVEKLLTLSPGENLVELVAYNAQGDVASNPVQQKLLLEDSISEKPALHVLAVGINKYRDKTLWLKHAVPDGKALAKELRTSGKGIFTQIHVKELLDQEVTFAGLEKAFQEIGQKAKSHDVFILYLAGHGITQDGRYHFLPADFRYRNADSVRKKAINQDHLQGWLSQVSARKSLVLLDTCNSGSYVQAQAITRGISEKTAIDKLTRATGRATIAASSDTQVAYEGHKGHGVFTYALLQALKQADQKYGNRDGVVSTAEIASYVDEAVPDITYKKWGYEQVPQVNLHGRQFPIGVVK